MGDARPTPGPADPGIKNPWQPNQWSLTEQGKVYMRDKALAHQLAEQAGSFVGATNPTARSA